MINCTFPNEYFLKKNYNWMFLEGTVELNRSFLNVLYWIHVAEILLLVFHFRAFIPRAFSVACTLRLQVLLLFTNLKSEKVLKFKKCNHLIFGFFSTFSLTHFLILSSTSLKYSKVFHWTLKYFLLTSLDLIELLVMILIWLETYESSAHIKVQSTKIKIRTLAMITLHVGNL